MPKDTCSVEGCDKRLKGRLYCSMHQERLRRHGNLGGPEPKVIYYGPNAKFRTCTKCGQEKPASDFPRVQNKCKACVLVYKLEYAAANRERVRESGRNYYHRNRDKAAEYRITNHETIRKYHADRRAANPEYGKENSRRWRLTNPSQALAGPRRIYRSQQADSLSKAHRHQHEWAGWELELVSDKSRTTYELAIQLGRTYAAVRSVRAALLHDPQTIQRAGISKSGRV